MKKTKKILSALILTIAFSAIFSLSQISEASAATSSAIIPQASGKSSCTEMFGKSASECGDYTVNDFVKVGLNIANWIFGIVGSLTLLMFVYGGFMFLISAGSSDKVSQAKKIITAAIVGLVIVFASYVIVKFVLGDVLGVGWSAKLPS